MSKALRLSAAMMGVLMYAHYCQMTALKKELNGLKKEKSEREASLVQTDVNLAAYFDAQEREATEGMSAEEWMDFRISEAVRDNNLREEMGDKRYEKLFG